MLARPDERMITFIFRKRSATVFSIEKLFDALYIHLGKSGVRVRRLELPHTSTGIISVLRNTWFVARQRSMGLLHITGDVHYAALLRPFSTTVITIHDCVVLQRGTGLRRFVFWLLWFGVPVRLASAVTVISEQTEAEVSNTVAASIRKMTVIPNFVDPSFAFSARSFPAQPPRILHVGTTPNKNLDRVIGALRDIPCTLVIVGQLARETLRDLAAYEFRYEHWVGVEDMAMIRLYEEADIISFPSTYEGFGMPIVEGQAVGRPVLTSDLEPMRSIAGKGGALLVDPYSVASIREGFLSIIRDAALRSRLIAAGVVNSRRFTLEAVAARYLALYGELDKRTRSAF
jgi:glycosyltransferase involved in cell wall biosynthesis